MNNDFFANMNKLGKSGYDAMKELYDINMNIASQYCEQQMALSNLCIEYATAQMEMVGKSKGYKDMVAAQTSLINETSEKIQGIARNTVDIINESKDEVSAWVEKGVEDASAIVPFNKKSA